MQAFWLAGERGNELVEFPFTYLFDDARWVPRRDVFLVGTRILEAAVDVEPHLRRVPRHRRRHRASTPRIDVPASRVAELGIACEACHGPAAAHVAANRDPFRRWSLHDERRRRRDHRESGAPAAGARAPRSAASATASAARPTAGCSAASASAPATPLADDEADPAAAPASATSACRAQIAADASFAPSRYWTRRHGARLGARVQRPRRVALLHQRGALTCVSCHSMHDSDPNWQLARGKRRRRAPARSATPPSASNVAAHTHHARRLDGIDVLQLPYAAHDLGPFARDAQPPDHACRACRTTSTPGGRTRATCAISIARSAGRPTRSRACGARRRRR